MSTAKPLDIDVETWAKAWGEDVNASEVYQDTGKGWKDPLIFVISAKPEAGLPEDMAIYLDLYDGQCRTSRTATAADLAEAPYVLRVDPGMLRQVFDGELDPEDAFMQGKVTIERGRRSKLSAYVESSNALMDAGRSSADRVGVKLPAAD